jgi:multidrug efflux pump subunit AcrA (membrane-fusion protein)
VARRDRDRAAAMLNYARVTAPFDGIVTQRNVDRGAFVQNATSASTESLVSIARTDIVTVVIQLPDNAAPYVSRDTAVELQLNELPGVRIHGKVTRFAPAIRGTDRTVRIEMDLFNGSTAAYGRFVAKATASAFAAAAAGSPAQALPLIAAGQDVWAPNQKGSGDQIPPQPLIVGGTAARLLPGMGGTARVHLQEFGESFLLPSSAVFSLGGMPYVLEVHNGKTRLVTVRVQVNDGRLAKVAVVERPAGGRGGGREVVREFTGVEQIVASRQLEIGEGQAVRATPEAW